MSDEKDVAIDWAADEFDASVRHYWRAERAEAENRRLRELIRTLFILSQNGLLSPSDFPHALRSAS